MQQDNSNPTEQAPDWDVDPNTLLDDMHVNPQLRSIALAALEKAKADGLRPRVQVAYRTPEESQREYELWQSGQGPRAAPAWQSAHNYGLAMDVYLYDENGGLIDFDNKEAHPDWYRQVKNFATKYMSEFVWGEPINDTDHFEYHPNWQGLVKGALLLSTRDQAQQMTDGNTDYSVWIHYFWQIAGAEEQTSTDANQSGD